jgi:hypothetical protein
VRKLINYIMKGMAAIWGMIEDYIFYVVCLHLSASFFCLAKFFALFSARVFSCRNSPLLLGDLI